MKRKSEGKCRYCKKSFEGSAVTRHIASCAERKEANSKEHGNDSIFLIKAGAGPFWAYFEVNASRKLSEVDDFLRDLWLECCGHLSMFKINNAVYAYDPQPEYDDKDMKIPLNKVLSVGTSFSHEYDFGTTTTLGLKCLSERTGDKLKKINVISRNEMPNFKCKCGSNPKDVCSQCLWEIGLGAMLCKACAKKHKCGEEMLLPVVNSPRMGMCGYTGD